MNQELRIGNIFGSDLVKISVLEAYRMAPSLDRKIEVCGEAKQRFPKWVTKAKRQFLAKLFDIRAITNTFHIACFDDVLRAPGLIDGNNRLNAICQFIDGKIALGKDAPVINGYNLSEKKYAQIPDYIRKIFDEQVLRFEIHVIHETEAGKLFVELNSSNVVNAIDSLWSLMDVTTNKMLQKITKAKFFDVINYSENQINNREHLKQALNFLILEVYGTSKGLSKKTQFEFVKNLEADNIDVPDYKVYEKLNYMSKIFSNGDAVINQAITTATCMQTTYSIAECAIERGISPKVYYDFLKDLYVTGGKARKEIKKGNISEVCASGAVLTIVDAQKEGVRGAAKMKLLLDNTMIALDEFLARNKKSA